MCRNSTLKQQAGFLLPLAIFIVVVMALFALVLTRNTIQTNSAASQEAISVQAFYAAESGTQKAMGVLYYPDASKRVNVDSRCVSLSTTYSYTEDGLKNCSAVVACSCVYADGSACAPATASNYSNTAVTGKLTSFYKVTSAATCGSGNLKAVRTIEAESFLKQE